MINNGRFFLFLFFIFLFFQSAFAQADCKKMNDDANAKAASFYPRESYTVKGSGRLYFYEAPSPECLEKNTFVIPGDSLVVYSDFKGWYNVGFFNSKTGGETDGWVKPERLKYNGTLGPK